MKLEFKKVKAKYNVIDYVPEAHIGLIEVATSEGNHFKAYDLTVEKEERLFISLMDLQKECEWKGEKGNTGLAVVDRNRTVEKLMVLIPSFE